MTMYKAQNAPIPIALSGNIKQICPGFHQIISKMSFFPTLKDKICGTKKFEWDY
jgi:hypothetical protein